MKKQQNRGRATRRYEEARRKRRKFECGCALCRNKWHAKPEDRFTIDALMGEYFDATIIETPGLKRLPQADSVRKSAEYWERIRASQEEKALQRQAFRLARLEAHKTEYGPDMRTWKDY